MLCDISKVHTGFLFMPKVTHSSEDDTWGQIGSSKKLHFKGALIPRGRFMAVDHIVKRDENVCWNIQIDNFQPWSLGFSKFVGEWRTTQCAPDVILVEYSYTLHAFKPLYFPIQWLLAKVFWRLYMKRVLANVRHMVDTNEPYCFD